MDSVYVYRQNHLAGLDGLRGSVAGRAEDDGAGLQVDYVRPVAGVGGRDALGGLGKRRRGVGVVEVAPVDGAGVVAGRDLGMDRPGVAAATRGAVEGDKGVRLKATAGAESERQLAGGEVDGRRLHDGAHRGEGGGGA